MARVKSVAPLFLVLLFSASASSASEDSQKMEQFRVVPDIISKTPPARVTVTYPGGLAVDMGNELTPTQVHDKPTITWDGEEGAYYTLLMTDHDIPPQIGAKEVQHWLVVNIPGNDVSKGDTIFEYVGSGPPEGTGLHRYIFILFKQQTGKLEESSYSSMKDDKLGKLKTRLANSLTGLQSQLKLGEPVAANFFQAKFDENVPIYRQEMLKKYSS